MAEKQKQKPTSDPEEEEEEEEEEEKKVTKKRKAAPKEKKEKKKKAKKEKDPNAPKRPLTAFIIFGQDKRPEIKAKHPKLPVSEVGKMLGEMWNALSDAEKKPYQDKAAKEKEKYQELVAKQKAAETK